MAELLGALKERYPESQSTVAWQPDAQLEAPFARQPPLSTALGDALGFLHDGTLSELIAQAMQ
jgi:D-erythronate 2-dehydrogenase